MDRVFDTWRLPVTDQLLVGRDAELDRLDTAWRSDGVRVVTVVGRGGEGKTALVNRWLARGQRRGDFADVHVYGWTFYSQGSTGAGGASADLFFDHALKTFGYDGPVIASPVGRAEELVRRLAAARTLLIIDGLEPMQHGPGAEVVRGRLLDPGLRVLLRQLALNNPGLCVLTTREQVADVADDVGETVELLELSRLSAAAGAELLWGLGARGSGEERQAAVEEMEGHALALTLLGTYVRSALGGDIRRRDEIRSLKVGARGEHAWRVMGSYEDWLGDGPTRAVLRLLGLFDRAATRDEVRALLAEPAIVGLTDGLVGLDEPTWQQALTTLRDARLLAEAVPSGDGGLDAHPLVRDYAAERLRAEQPEAWKAGHERLYRHLCAAAPDRPETLSEMRPLFLAVRHGCAAGRHEEVCVKVLRARIDRVSEFFTTRQLGGFGARLGAIAHLFEQPFAQLAVGLSEVSKMWLLNEAGFGLRAIGRLLEARTPMLASLDAYSTRKVWKHAAIVAGNLAELNLTLGELNRAKQMAAYSVKLADQSGDASQRMANRTTLADVLHQRGDSFAAELFVLAESMQAEREPAYQQLYSLPGYRYCDLLLGNSPANAELYNKVRERASQSLVVVRRNRQLISIGLDHLTLARIWLLQAEFTHAPADADAWAQAHTELNHAVRGLREAGAEEFIVCGLIARAAYHRARLAHGELDSEGAAERDLAEAYDIASRGGMRLFLADIALERTRLALALSQSEQARTHLAQAQKLIQATGYHRRDPDVAALTAAVSASELAAEPDLEADAATPTATEYSRIEPMPPTATTIPTHLCTELRAGRVIPFIGAGVSRAVKDRDGQPLYPSWPELIKRGADRIESDNPARATLVRALIDDSKPDYLQAADRLRDAMVGPVWLDFLKEQLNPRRSRVDDSTLALAKAAWQLGSQLVMTTNYDRVLDWSCPESDDLRTLDNTATAELAQLLRQPADVPTVWHLHGRIDNVANMVLTTDSYNVLYGSAIDESKYQAAKQALHQHLTQKTILFIGFSLDDAHVGATLKAVASIFKGYESPPYALIRASEAELVRRDIESAGLNVQVVPFTNFGQPLLDTLTEMARCTPAP